MEYTAGRERESEREENSNERAARESTGARRQPSGEKLIDNGIREN